MRQILTVTQLASAVPGFGQSLINPAKAPHFAAYFEERKEDKALRCEVTPIQPRLNFSFRFQAGYVFQVPMNQFTGAGHR